MNTFFKYKDENYLYYHVRLSQIYITLIIPVLRQMLIMCQMTMLKQIYIYLTSEGLYHMSLAPSEIKSSGNSSFWFVQFSIVTPTAFWTRDGEQNVQFQLKLSEVVKWHGNGKWQGSILCNFCRQQCNTRQRISKLLVMILSCVTHLIHSVISANSYCRIPNCTTQTIQLFPKHDIGINSDGDQNARRRGAKPINYIEYS